MNSALPSGRSVATWYDVPQRHILFFAGVSSMMKRIFVASLALLVAAAVAQAEQGNPGLKTIDSIAFGPNGLLLIGSGTQVVTVETGDTKQGEAVKSIEVANIDGALAGK